MALTAEEAARLSKLQAAYDKVVSGTQVSRIAYDGMVREFGTADPVRLQAEIDKLTAIAASTSGCGRLRGAVRFRV